MLLYRIKVLWKNSWKVIKEKNIAFIGPGLGGGSFGGGVGVGLRKVDTDLLKMFNKAIDEARADGSLAKHFSKWFGKDISM